MPKRRRDGVLVPYSACQGARSLRGILILGFFFFFEERGILGLVEENRVGPPP
jgi:hypothetical protein